ncbi:MAG: sigma-70 family RNA polymerase sigma factor [Steroidobacteraceae bacterium]
MTGIDNKRFCTLIEPHLDAVFRAAYRLTRNRSDAEDLVQETCIRACDRLNELKETGPVKSWLLRVMHNLFVDGARRARLSPVSVRENDTDPAAALVCPEPTPEQSLENGQRVAQLERAWARLDRGHQALLALRAEGYTLSEISRITNIAMDALSMRLYRARQNLTRCLQQERAPSSATPMEAVK